MRADDFQPGQYQVTDEHNLNRLTAEGWSLVRILPSTEPQSFTENSSMTQHGLTGASNYTLTSPTTMVTRTMMRKTHRYLLRLDTEGVVAKLNDQLAKLTVDFQTLKADTDGKIAADKRVMSTMKVQLEGAQREAKDASDKYERMAGAAAETRVAFNKFQDDFGLVWQAVGDIEMRRILGPLAANPKPLTDAQRRTAFDRITNGDL